MTGYPRLLFDCTLSHHGETFSPQTKLQVNPTMRSPDIIDDEPVTSAASKMPMSESLFAYSETYSGMFWSIWVEASRCECHRSRKLPVLVVPCANCPSPCYVKYASLSTSCVGQVRVPDGGVASMAPYVRHDHGHEGPQVTPALRTSGTAEFPVSPTPEVRPSHVSCHRHRKDLDPKKSQISFSLHVPMLVALVLFLVVENAVS